MKLPVIKLEPNRVRRNYLGGKTIDEIRGNKSAFDGDRPEEWLCSVVSAKNPGLGEVEDEGLSKFNYEGNLYLLKNVLKEFPQYYLGTEQYKSLSFLTKWLDSSIRLHMQAHPTKEFSKRHLNSNYGKFEAYYVISIRENLVEPYIRLGFQRKEINKELWKEIIEKQDYDEMDKCFEKIPIKPNDLVFIPGGVPHAIGEGIFLLEIMEPSDHVVRCEFERCGIVVPEQARFMGKSLDFCLDVFDYSYLSKESVLSKFFVAPMMIIQEPDYIEEILMSDDISGCFEVRRIKMSKKRTILFDTRYAALVCVKGSATISSGVCSYPVEALDNFFIASETDHVTVIVEGEDEIELILILPSDT